MSSARGFELVIFDCDGVLIDSELIAAREHTLALNKAGFSISQTEVMDRFTGIASAEMYAELEAEFGRQIPEGHHDEVKRNVLKAYESDLKPIPGIHAAVSAISIPKCVASSSIPVKLEAGLKATELHAHFTPNIFSAAQVAKGKPAPDLFLFAATQLGVNPAQCLVIEDSPAGTEAGIAAGMTTVGFTGGSHCRPDLAKQLKGIGARTTFSDMARLPGILEGLTQP
ncbi:MAG: HAD family hydrolase [Pseudomonadota bacterium]